MVRPYKPIERSAAHVAWFCHVPAKKQEKPPRNKEQVQETILSINETGTLYNEPLHNGGKRSLRLSEDETSMYMRTVLDGGRKDLIQWKKEDDEQRQDVSYHIPEWYSDSSCEEKKDSQTSVYERVIPEWFIHDQDEEDGEKRKSQPRLLKRPIYGWDTLSSWKRNEAEMHGSKITSKIEGKTKNKIKKTRDKDNSGKSKQTELKLPLIVQKPRNNERSESFGKWYSKWYIERGAQSC